VTEAATNEGQVKDGEQLVGGVRACAATTKAGQPCPTPALKGDTYCWTHSPRLAEKRRAGSARGGRTSSDRRKLLLGMLAFGDAASVKVARQALAAAVIIGQCHPARASVVAGLLKDAEGAFVAVELEARMSRIEASLAKLVAQRSRSAGEA